MSRTKSGKENAKIQEFKDRISKEAEDFLHVVFPEKVKELDGLLQSEMFLRDNDDIHFDLNIPVPPPASVIINGEQGDAPTSAEPPPPKKRKSSDPQTSRDLTGVAAVVPGNRGTPVYALPNGTSPSNGKILTVINVVKPLIKALVEQTNSMKMWILFLIPKIEDGNNFGVSVQEETLAEVRQVESESATYLEQLSRYFITRAKLVSKLAKYPHIEDYRRAIDEIDEKEYLSLKLTVAELRNNYSSLHDLIIKNLDKITTPRTSTNMHIY